MLHSDKGRPLSDLLIWGRLLTRGAHLVTAVDNSWASYHRPLDSGMGGLKILGGCNVGGCGDDHGENLR